MARLLETDLATRAYRVTSGFNEALYQAANEPSLGMYRIQEHVSLTVPKVVEQRQNLQETCQQVEGACYDLEYDTETLKAMRSITQFAGLKDKMMRAIELKVKLNEAAHRTAFEGRRQLGVPRYGVVVAKGEEAVPQQGNSSEQDDRTPYNLERERKESEFKDSITSGESEENRTVNEDLKPKQFD